MKSKHRHMVFVLLMILLAGQSVAASPRSAVPVLPSPGERTALTTPVPAAATMDRIEISCPPSPYTLLLRQRKTVTQITQPSPLCHAQHTAAWKENGNRERRRCNIRYRRLALPTEQIAYPFTAFW